MAMMLHSWEDAVPLIFQTVEWLQGTWSPERRSPTLGQDLPLPSQSPDPVRGPEWARPRPAFEAPSHNEN